VLEFGPNQFGHRFIYDWTLKLKLWSVEMYYLTATIHSVLYVHTGEQPGVVPDAGTFARLSKFLAFSVTSYIPTHIWSIKCR
jgi:hypothetical protein